MQKLLTSLSKILILLVLSCSLLIVWEGNSLQLTQEAEESTVASEIDSIWGNITNEFQIDHQENSARVQKEIRRLLADQNEFYRILRAATPYIQYIYKQTRAYGLPAEIALIPFIESEFNPYDHSSAGATGLWQLMPATARGLGVQVKGSYDGRRNVIASTKAALVYFRDLGNLFKGNWYLAIAAYNCGEGRIFSAQHRSGTHNYWNLPLPMETKLYVPRLLAVAEIIEHPDKYGIELPRVNNEPFFTEVKTDKPVDLAKISEHTGVPVKTLTNLNPDFNKQTVAPSAAAVHSILVPAAKAPMVKSELKNTQSPLAPTVSKVIKPKTMKKKGSAKKKIRKRVSHRTHHYS